VSETNAEGGQNSTNQSSDGSSPSLNQSAMGRPN